MDQKKRVSFWNFQGGDHEQSAFGSLDDTIHHSGEIISRDPISYVKRIRIHDTNYYVKVYKYNGKGVRRYLGRGRIRGEWENLLYFAQLGIPTPRLVGYGQKCRLGQFSLGALITEELVNAQDLGTMARDNAPQLQKHYWLDAVMSQCADYTRRLHEQGFVHWDLKWRNILVSADEQPQVYFFDCPLGRCRFGWLKRRGFIKDLACLDKVARKILTRSQRLNFYKRYSAITRLDVQHKKQIRQIVNFFAKERDS
ncbi:MAG: hypothetical protein J7K75_13295 [Desulfuromonas sp.]|nr:hypothetical protein [Desulfuromonas sp.]